VASTLALAAAPTHADPDAFHSSDPVRRGPHARHHVHRSPSSSTVRRGPARRRACAVRGRAAQLQEIAGPVVLVGHSYGGAVITNAARGNPAVKALVFIAGFVPDAGESLVQLDTQMPGSLVAPALVTVPFVGPGLTVGIDTYINPLLYPSVLAADVPLATAQDMSRTQHPITLAALTDRSGVPASRTIPSWYLVARQDRALPPAMERFMAERANAHTTEIDSSHAAPVSHPDAVSTLIREAAQASSG